MDKLICSRWEGIKALEVALRIVLSLLNPSHFVFIPLAMWISQGNWSMSFASSLEQSDILSMVFRFFDFSGGRFTPVFVTVLKTDCNLAFS